MILEPTFRISTLNERVKCKEAELSALQANLDKANATIAETKDVLAQTEYDQASTAAEQHCSWTTLLAQKDEQLNAFVELLHC